MFEWILQALGIFATTAGALLTFLAHRQVPRLLAGATTPEGKLAFDMHHRRLSWALGLVASALVLQCGGMFFL
jgi:hypothetical protein